MSLGAELPSRPRYMAYMVRLWQDSQYGQWRASVQAVQTGERVLFASMDELFAFLEGQTVTDPSEDQESSL